MSQPNAVDISNLSKEYGAINALQGVDLVVPAGSVVGILGPNGSGKTTLLKHIAGLVLPSRGSVKTFGTEAKNLNDEQLGRVGYVSQQSELMDWLTVGETIEFVSAHHINWDTEMATRLLKDFELESTDKVGALSVGKKQRLAIILGVAHKPDLLLLDEPAASLDPLIRQDFLDLLMELIQDQNRTIFISSHILSDVEKVIDQVLIIDHGRVHCFQPIDELREHYHRVHLSALTGELPKEIKFTGLKHLQHNGASAVATVFNPDFTMVEKEAAELSCRVEIRNLDFQEIYRLVVAGK